MLTLQEKKIVEYAKANGKTAQETVQALSRFRNRPQQAVKTPSFLEDFVGDIKGVGTGITEAITKRGKKLGEILEADSSGEQGKLSSAFQATTNFLGSVTDVVGQGIKGAVKAVLPQGVEDKLKEGISTVGQKVLELPEVQTLLENYDALKKNDPEKARNAVALMEGGEFLLNFIGLNTAKKGTEAVIKKGVELAGKTGEGVEAGLKTGKELVTSVGEKTSTLLKPLTRVTSRMGTNVAERQATELAIKQLPSKLAQDAVRDGIDLTDVKTLISSSSGKSNKKALRELANTVRDFEKGATKTNPIELVGKPIVSKLKQLETLRGKKGVQLGEVANKLGNVTDRELRPEIFAQLKKVPGLNGLKLTDKGILNFTDTVLATGATKADRIAINKIFADAVKSGTGKSKHLLRQELFEILGGKKAAMQAITGTQENAFNAIRKGLANILEGKNATYKQLSKEYATIVRPLKDMRKLMKAVGGSTDEDILNMSAGLIARRLTGASASNPQVRAILRSMDAVSKGSSEASVEVLQDFYNILNRYYDIAPKTGFQGGITNSLESTGVKSAVVNALKKVAGETPAVRKKALENLLISLFES